MYVCQGVALMYTTALTILDQVFYKATKSRFGTSALTAIVVLDTLHIAKSQQHPRNCMHYTRRRSAVSLSPCQSKLVGPQQEDYPSGTSING